ncbi:MAG: nucleotidyltransferase domain-containing protein [Planctomycetota bacterium]
MSEKPFDQLKCRASSDWGNISNARSASYDTLKKLQALEFFPETDSNDPNLNVQIVVNGSLARGEWTSGSDVDWHLLVDGPANPQHLKLAQGIGSLIETHFPRPNPSGAFGKMSSSHELMHWIGGPNDSNENLTRRMLLLLESFAIPEPANRIVLDRVTKHVLRRYIDLDPSVSRLNSTEPIIPRFLLNDVVRYWRTIAVDYAAKKWEYSGKWALRNAKLRMSRKMIFAKGLLMCLKCASLPDRPTPKEMDAAVIQHCEDYAAISAIDVMARHLLEVSNIDLAKKLFDAYDGFLSVIDDEGKRKELAELDFHSAEKNSIFQAVRDYGRVFQSGLSQLFFDEDNGLAELTKEYGVF